MTQLQPDINPFALMTDPQAVFAALARSERLSSLESRLYRPLDKPQIGAAMDDGLAAGCTNRNVASVERVDPIG